MQIQPRDNLHHAVVVAQLAERNSYFDETTYDRGALLVIGHGDDLGRHPETHAIKTEEGKETLTLYSCVHVCARCV